MVILCGEKGRQDATSDMLHVAEKREGIKCVSVLFAVRTGIVKTLAKI